MGRTRLAPKPDWHNKDYFHLGMPVMKQGMTLPFTEALPDFLEYIKNYPVICITGHTLGMFFDVYEYEDCNGKLHYAYNPKRGLTLKTKKSEIMEALKHRLLDVTKITVIMTNERAKEAWDLFIANTLISLRDTFVPVKSDKKSDTYYETTYQFTGINGKSYIALDTHEDTPTKLDDVKRDLDNFEVLSKIRGGLKTYKALDYANVIFHVISDAIVFDGCPDEFKDDKFKLYYGKDKNGEDVYVSQTNKFIWDTRYTKDEIAFLEYKRGKVHSNVSLWDNAIEEMNTRYVSVLNDKLCVDLRNWFVKNQVNIKNMRFDLIIGNPPYDDLGNTLSESIMVEMLNNITPNGIVVCLNQLNFFNSVYNKVNVTTDGGRYNRYKETLLPFISCILKIPRDKFNSTFGIGGASDGAIIVMSKRKTKYFSTFNNKEIYKILSEDTGILRNANTKTPTPYFVVIRRQTFSKEDLNFIETNKKYLNKDIRNFLPVYFDTKNERDNFIDCYKSPFMQWIIRNIKEGRTTPVVLIPYMFNYKKQWTDDMFRKHFKFTDIVWANIIKEIGNGSMLE